jgi:type I restriction enzyme S subunit
MTDLLEMNKYDTYKDSGVDWLGVIPSEWNLVPGFMAYSENKRNNKGLKEEQVLSLSYGKIIIKPKEKLVGLVPESFETYQIVEPSDLIIRCMDLQNDKTSLRTGLSVNHGIITSAYLNLKINEKYDSKFLYYYLHSLDTTKVLYKFGTGLRQNLSFQDFYRLPVFDIPKSLQIAIANFLDIKTAQIDEAVAIKQQQIELLKERKQIIIQQAVTQGLDPNIPLIETELSWAPKIASHWSLLPNRLFMKIRRVPVGLAHKNYQLLSLTKQGVLIRDLSKGAGKQSDFLERMQEVRKGDLIFCLFDVEETPRTVGLSGHLGMISADYTIFECIDEPTGRFLEYFYKNIDDLKLLKPLYKGLRKRIPKPRFLRANCPMPPRDELIKIIQHLDTLEVSITHTIEIILSQIEKLKEYKTTLINSAVTGKIKVPQNQESVLS